MACDRLLLAMLFFGTFISTVFFFSGFSAHDAHIIFLFDAIIPLAILETGFLLS